MTNVNRKSIIVALAALLFASGVAIAKDMVKIAFIGPMSGGNSASGI